MTRFLLFLSSLAPGVVVVSMRHLGDHTCAGVIGIAIGVLFTILGMLTIRTRGKTKPIPTELAQLKDETYQIPTYLVTFILPFLFVEVKDLATIGAYGVFILLVATILYKNDISIVSPALLIRGFRLYDAVDSEYRNITVISKSPPPPVSRDTKTYVTCQVRFTYWSHEKVKFDDRDPRCRHGQHRTTSC